MACIAGNNCLINARINVKVNCATEVFPYFSTLIKAILFFVQGSIMIWSYPVERVEIIRKFLNFSSTLSVISEVIKMLIIVVFSKSSSDRLFTVSSLRLSVKNFILNLSRFLFFQRMVFRILLNQKTTFCIP